MLIDQRSQRLWDRQNQMSILHAWVQHRLDRRHPLQPIHLRTRETKLAFTTEGDHAPLLALRTEIDRVPVGRITTAQHLLHDLIHGCVAGMFSLELLPAVSEDLLEAVLVDVTGRCHAPQSSQAARLCQTRRGPEKEIPMGSSYLGFWVKVFPNRVEFKAGPGMQSIPISQIASIQLGMMGVWQIILETTGGMKFKIPTHKKKEVKEAIYRGCINKLLDRQRVNKAQILERVFRTPMKTAAYVHEFIHT